MFELSAWFYQICVHFAELFFNDLQSAVILGLNFLWSGRGGSLKLFQVSQETEFRPSVLHEQLVISY